MSDPIVFVVDDDKAVADAITALLKSVFENVETFSSGEAFLDRFDREDRGCLIIDMRLPGMSGLEVQRELRARESRLPVIMISGHADADLTEQALKNGAIACLAKPFSPASLVKYITRSLSEN